MSQNTCLKCGGIVELGYQVDCLGRQAYRQAQWLAGPPEAKDDKFLGMQMYEDWVVRVKEEDLKPVIVMRCKDCGFLEYYAP